MLLILGCALDIVIGILVETGIAYHPYSLALLHNSLCTTCFYAVAIALLNSTRSPLTSLVAAGFAVALSGFVTTGLRCIAVHCSLWVASAMVRSLHLLESLILCIVEDALHCCCHLLALGLLLLHTGYILLGLLEAEFRDLIILILTQ